MKIAVITMHAVKNYGSALQTFATQQVLSRLGYETEIINYIRKKNIDSNLIDVWTSKEKGLRKITKKMLMYPTIKKWIRVWGNYLQTYIHLSAVTYTEMKDFSVTPVQADILCTGSDQVWNSGWNDGVEYPFYLSFADDNTPKISFSASFGKEKLDENEIEIVKPLLQKYDYITVREQSAVSILNNMGIKDVSFTLDPTLFLTKEQWKNHMKKSKPDEPYILVYQLNKDKNFDKMAVNFAKSKKMKLVRLCLRYDQIILPGRKKFIPEIREFLSLINNAEYVITDSFHATAFSINFNKQFFSVLPQKYNCRLKEFLDIFDLENRIVSNYLDFESAGTIDYGQVNKILDDERKKSMEHLKYALRFATDKTKQGESF